MLFFSYSLLLFYLHPLQTTATSKTCFDAFQCANQTTTITGWNSNDYVIYNHGYKSHYGSSSSINSNWFVYCTGAFACSKSSLHTYNTVCSGVNSCFATSSSSYFQANGANALAHSHIEGGGSHAYCGGERSCAHSIISGIPFIKAQGAYSLLNTLIDSKDTTQQAGFGAQLIVTLSGYYAGFGATITCREGHNCTVLCYNNACTNLNFDCHESSMCVTKSSSKDTVITTNSPFNTEDILIYNSLAISKTLDNTCYSTLSWDDFTYERSMSYIDCNATNEGPICCRAVTSCRNIRRIDCASSTGKAVACMGEYACASTPINNPYGPVFCGGKSSCEATTIKTKSMVLCSGYDACNNADIIGGSDIYCSGSGSCRQSLISINQSNANVYLLGEYAGLTAHITCSASSVCFIGCHGWKSCKDVNLECDGLCRLYCDEDSICPTGWTSNWTPNITINAPPFFPTTTTDVPVTTDVQQDTTNLMVPTAVTEDVGHTTAWLTDHGNHNESRRTNPSKAAALVIAILLVVILMVTACVGYISQRQNMKSNVETVNENYQAMM